jgi:hypothetical protein
MAERPLSWESRDSYPNGDRSAVGPAGWSSIEEALAAYSIRMESLFATAYRVPGAEPRETFEFCCPDGGSELLVVVSTPRGRTHVLLVVWGVGHRAERRKTLKDWAAAWREHLEAVGE